MNATELTIVRPRLLVTDDTEYYNFADNEACHENDGLSDSVDSNDCSVLGRI